MIPLPLDPQLAVHFDVVTSNNTSESSTAKQESFPFEREFLEDCEPMRNPQVHPTCNYLHELPMHDDQTTLLSTTGSWRTAWTVNNNTSVLKVLQYSRSFDSESFERHALDVIVSDHLTASPYIIDAYGFCGQSIIQEWAPSGGRDVVKSYDVRNRQRLKIARDLARGLADLQALQVIPHETYKDGGFTRRHIPSPPPLVFSHNDINIANTIYSDSRQVIKWNDFNIGVFLRTRKGSNFTQDCGAPVKFRADLWRSPEEVRNTSYVHLPYTDMYGFGNILYQVMTRHQPWTHKEPEGQLTVAQVAERKREGRLPTMPEKYLNTTSKDLQIMVLATMSCYHPVPTKRLTAYEMAHALSYLYDRLQHKQPVPFSMLQDFFLRK
jgi:serine/threonine protein kinase